MDNHKGDEPGKKVVIDPDSKPYKGDVSVPTVSKDDVLEQFKLYIENISYFSSDEIASEEVEISDYVKNLQQWKDKELYAEENNLRSLLKKQQDSLFYYNDHTDAMLESFIEDYYGGMKVENKEECMEEMSNILAQKLKSREENLNMLAKELGEETIHLDHGDKASNKWWWLIPLALVALCAFAWWKWGTKNMRRPKKPAPVPNRPTNNTRLRPTREPNRGSDSGISRVNTTQIILRLQNIDDVRDDEQYMRIDTSEFCDDSAVRFIYVKNTVVKDIYNMYAEDLRNPENPKEDGCLVLGRWVYDESDKVYDVTYEQVVFPGDDAVFGEYDFNFGAKIKIKLRERLKRLRIETKLQYDNTCWVHSHPGLGVFFSNDDNNVHLSLKRHDHPRFLTALVIDILTPEQELGIFTFKRDGSIISKSDLKKTYSLEEWYQWAVGCDRWAFKPEDHFDILDNAKAHHDDCLGLHLSNGAIIDMAALATEGTGELVAFVQGFATKLQGKTRYVANEVKKKEELVGHKPDGAFIVTSDIQKVEKMMGEDLSGLHYLMVLNTDNDKVTVLPVEQGRPCMDENYHGQQQLQDLKIWTRRKR
ncbi:MAG: hypothetical protein IKH88_18315 [Prevotella sp.]|nr:hypothetical protein [Prevotella sp.]